MAQQLSSRSKEQHSPGFILFAVTIFLSAFLLFQVQPLISRYILPWFGGTPAVWSAALLFFQTFLLAGYAFAHWLSSQSIKRLPYYLVLLIISLALLIGAAIRWGSPLLPDAGWKPDDPSQPLFRILAILATGVGLPYFLLATTSPLLQSWFRLLRPGQKPYRLYAISNFGSLLGLISFPFLFEPLFGLVEQSWIWSLLYCLFLGLCFYLGLRVLGNRTPYAPTPAMENRLVSTSRKPLLNPFQKFLWLALPACSSILLLAITNQITQDMAVIPFLWVLPLSVYLFSFMVSFSGEKWYPRLWLIGGLALATLSIAYRVNVLRSTDLYTQIGIFVIFLLLACWVCHGELYRIRPESSQLTHFYLYIALGSVIGSLFVNLVAPMIFKGFWELHLGVLFCWVLILILLKINRPSKLNSRWFGEGILILAVILGVSAYLYIRQINVSLRDVVEIQRSFYGVLRVRYFGRGDPPELIYDLRHGSTSHGFQFRDTAKRTIPTSYYARQSGVGLAISHYRADILNGSPLKVGLIGLGPGTLAAYGEVGDEFRFYEINPYVIDFANGDAAYFTYISDSNAGIEIIPGDARISLETELKNGQPQEYDILVLDAFSSDAIPTHLLTVEALQLYLQHLKPYGVVAINISNRYLNLAPVVRKLADYYGLQSTLVYNASDDTVGSYASNWMLLTNNAAFVQIPEILHNSVQPDQNDLDLRIWTDDYINLLPLIKENVFDEIQ